MRTQNFLLIIFALSPYCFGQQWHFGAKIEELLKKTIADSIACEKYLQAEETNRCLDCLYFIQHTLDQWDSEKPLPEQSALRHMINEAQQLSEIVLQIPECATAYDEAKSENIPEAWSIFRKLCAKRAAEILKSKTSLQFPSLQGRDYTNVPDKIRRVEFLVANADMNPADCDTYAGGIIFLLYLQQLQDDALKK